MYPTYYVNRTRWLAYSDILGFMDYIDKTELDTAISEVESAFNEAIEAALRIAAIEFPSSGVEASAVKRFYFSDTLLLYTEPNLQLDVAFFYMVLSSANLLARFIERGFLLRGAISYGQLHVNREKGIFIGKGLNDAHRWETKQEWAGCIVSPDTLSYVWGALKSSPLFDLLVKRGDLVNLEAPMKEDIKLQEKHYAINWTKYLSKPLQEISDLLKTNRKDFINKDSFIPGHHASTVNKIDNTLTFLKYLHNHGDRYLPHKA